MSEAPAVNSDAQASIVLNVMGLRELAVYGFRSWLLQDYDRPYEVVLNLFNDARPMFDRLLGGANPNCRVQIHEFPPPEFFNISAANNLGLNSSTGEYVLFANSDIIYPPRFLSRVMADVAGRNLCYAVAARANLTAAQCANLRPAEQYTRENGFDVLLGWEKGLPQYSVWPVISPWILRRDIAFAIGGFDPRVLVAEDKDLAERIMHYLRRKGLQHALVSLTDQIGYHLHHRNTGLFDSYTQSKAVFGPRGQRMDADPNNTEDVLDTPLRDREALLRIFRETKKPPLLKNTRYDYKGKISRRARKVWDALVYGR